MKFYVYAVACISFLMTEKQYTECERINFLKFYQYWRKTNILLLVNNQRVICFCWFCCFLLGGVSLWCCQGLKLYGIEWEDVWLNGKVWKVLLEGATLTFALHNGGSPQRTIIRIVSDLAKIQTSISWIRLQRVTTTPTHMVVLLLNWSYNNLNILFFRLKTVLRQLKSFTEAFACPPSSAYYSSNIYKQVL